MSADNLTSIIVAVISGISSIVVAVIAYRSSIDVFTAGELAKQKQPEQSRGNAENPAIDRRDLIKTILSWLCVAILIGITIAAIRNFYQPKAKTLWTFDQNAQSWLAEQPAEGHPEYAASSVSWDAASQALRATFDFANVPNPLSKDKEPRATFYVKESGNWSGFQSLQFKMKNLSKHDLKVIFTVSNSNCWYEFGNYQNIANMEDKVLKFNLKAYSYKTCKTYDGYVYPPVTFDQVWRFDIIIGTDEKPWKAVHGDLVIDDIQLTDPVTP